MESRTEDSALGCESPPKPMREADTCLQVYTGKKLIAVCDGKSNSFVRRDLPVVFITPRVYRGRERWVFG